MSCGCEQNKLGQLSPESKDAMRCFFGSAVLPYTFWASPKLQANRAELVGGIISSLLFAYISPLGKGTGVRVMTGIGGWSAGFNIGSLVTRGRLMGC